MGNWWSDYNGTGVYEIIGSANAIDRFPQNCTSWNLMLPLSDMEEPDFVLILVTTGGAVGIIILIIILFMKKGVKVQTHSASLTEEVIV